MEINIRNLHNGFFAFWDRNEIKSGCKLNVKIFLLDDEKEFFLKEQVFSNCDDPFLSMINIPSGDYKITYNLSDGIKEESNSIIRKIMCLASNYSELLCDIESIESHLENDILEKITEIDEKIDEMKESIDYNYGVVERIEYSINEIKGKNEY